MNDCTPAFRIDEQDEYESWLSTFAEEKYSVRCGICNAMDWGSQENLQIKGWLLSSRGEFCPSH
jgi:hypothetical protein